MFVAWKISITSSNSSMRWPSLPLRISLARSAQSCWQTAPLPSVVRSSVASWITTSLPSREGWTSNSTCSTASFAVCSNASRLFSGHSSAPPRCEAMSVMPIAAHTIGGCFLSTPDACSQARATWNSVASSK
jgi:hypothetical protein